MVKGYLSLRGIEFVDKNVSVDMEGRTELLTMGFDSTPVTVIGDRQLVGFDVKEIDDALASFENG
ncbi:MAG: glutaredoxin family protein [Chloroflexi bacterium]|jgi:hypothetical protein|nr:glutaredoxin family protein [Chloroflexota bacterium]